VKEHPRVLRLLRQQAEQAVGHARFTIKQLKRFSSEDVVACFNVPSHQKVFLELLEPDTRYCHYTTPQHQATLHLTPLPQRIHVWGRREIQGLLDYATQKSVPITRFHHGFLPLIAKEQRNALAPSFVKDEYGLYYDATQPSGLEVLLNRYDFSRNAEVLHRGRKAMKRMLQHDISRYSAAATFESERLYGPKHKKRVLCIGEHPDAAECTFGIQGTYSPDALINAARAQHPDAQIIFVLSGNVSRHAISPALLPSQPCTVVTQPLSVSDMCNGVEAIFTYTAHEGFEALMRGVPVTCLGLPFYAGWGLTHDAVASPRRIKKRGVDEVFTAAYMLYSRYVHPKTRQPCQLEDALDLIHRPSVLASNFAVWKRQDLKRLFPSKEITHLPIRRSIQTLTLPNKPMSSVFIWGMRCSEGLVEYAESHHLPVYRFEDGFIRSIGLGAAHIPPLSFCMDSRGIYFNAQQPSDLEHLIQTFPFRESPELLDRAKACMATIVQWKLGKYNLPETTKAAALYGVKTRTRILCIGQVEDDASILYGCDVPMTNNQLVEQAAADYPNAQIIYKAHPDVLAQKRPMYSNPNDVAHLCTVVNEAMSLDDALTGVDKVYTITSLAGFEALLRGVPVVCLGQPFYAGWGLTEDKAPHPRRNLPRTLAEVFAAAYILYPTYIHPETLAITTLEETLKRIIQSRPL
jgi:capsule polysaccharide export protein KpsC/LpsZ